MSHSVVGGLAFYEENSNLLRLRKLTNRKTKALVTAGPTITADLVPVGSSTQVPGSGIVLSYDGADGDWSGVYPSGLTLTVNQQYQARVTIDGGSPTASGKLYLQLVIRRREVVP